MGLRNSSSVSFFITKFFGKTEKIKKTPYLENHKYLSSHTWTLDLQLLSVDQYDPIKGLKKYSLISFFVYLSLLKKRIKF